MNREYIIRKLRPLSNLDKIKPRHRRRKEFYDGYVRAALVRCWEIFDYPCGQRLRQLGELGCSDEVAGELRAISARTIDEKLRHQKEVEGYEPHPKAVPGKLEISGFLCFFAYSSGVILSSAQKYFLVHYRIYVSSLRLYNDQYGNLY